MGRRSSKAPRAQGAWVDAELSTASLVWSLKNDAARSVSRFGTKEQLEQLTTTFVDWSVEGNQGTKGIPRGRRRSGAALHVSQTPVIP
jgi:hypothetical protein